MGSKKKMLFAILSVIFVGGAVTAGAVAINNYMNRVSPTPSLPTGEQTESTVIPDNVPTAQIEYNGKTYVYNINLSSLLIIGIDDREVEQYEGMINKSQADMLLLAVFDHESKTYSLIQINRDTMTDIRVYDSLGKEVGVSQHQIALAHTYRADPNEACEDTQYAVERLLYEVIISNYFAVTMDGIPVLNDSVGGVPVLIEDDFTGIDDTLVKGSTVTLHGQQAETFVRSRMSMKDDATNINRLARQRVYLTSLLDKLGSRVANNTQFAYNLYNDLDPYMVTDCTSDQLSTYISDFNGYTLKTIYTLDGESVKGDKYMEFYVDDEKLQDFIINTFYVEIK